MNNIFFFQTQQISDSSSSIFNQLKEQKIFFSYFLVKQADKQVDQNHYLFLFSQKSININFLYQSVEIIQELDSKQRKIRSLRGFFLYALEIIENGKDYEILQTNLQPFFWRKVKNLIRQNKKSALQEFLFGKDEDSKPDNQASNPYLQILEDQIQSLHNKVDSLQQKVFHLETLRKNSKYPLSQPSQALESSKTIQQGNSTLNTNSGSYFHKNNQGDKLDSNTLPEASKIDFKPLSNTHQYNTTLNQDRGLQQPNFITLGNLSEDEKIEIIQTGFQLQAQGTISLKKYYESKDPNSLFQLKGYSIKYDSIRRIKLYQQFKLSNN